MFDPPQHTPTGFGVSALCPGFVSCALSASSLPALPESKQSNARTSLCKTQALAHKSDYAS